MPIEKRPSAATDPGRTIGSPRPSNPPSRILVFRIGQLGDTMVAVPAIRALRHAFPQARMTLLCDRQVGRNYVLAPDLFEGSGLFDEFMVYAFDRSQAGRLARPVRMLRLLLSLRARQFDALVYLAPSTRSQQSAARDRRFFAMAGIKRFYGFDGFFPLPVKVPGRPLAAVPHEADLLLARLGASGIPVPPPGEGDMNLGLTDREDRQVDAWRSGLGPDGGRPWIGVGPGSKMPAKVWPEERFLEVVQGLIGEFGVWPVIFGGAEDRQKGDRLLRAWGCGYNAAGPLTLRPAAAALHRCRLYLGNDTGPMHLAASVRVPCIALFSSREYPGAWNPYGKGHRVFRTTIDCDGCLLVECLERRMECLRAITAREVLEVCRQALTTDRSAGKID